MRCSRRNFAAFTLIETIAAVVILSVAVPTLLWTLAESHRTRVDAALVTTATWLAVEKLEDVIADAHCPGRGFDFITAGQYPSEAAVSGFAGFSRSVQITSTATDLVTPGAECKIVTVEVSFIGSAKQARTLTLSTVLTDQTP
jgi:type II secretory pathway pseudopilin PulG